MKRRGRFIVLEGLDGAGTTTLLGKLALALRSQGKRVVATREPSDGPVGTLVRHALTHRLRLPDGDRLSPETLALLFAADRVDHLAAEIEPALARGAWVLCDRYVLSSLAYQSAEVPMPWVAELNRRARLPDLTLFVQVPPRVAGSRRAARGGRPELYESDARQRRVERLYRQALARYAKGQRVVYLDGTLAPDAVAARALEAVSSC